MKKVCEKTYNGVPILNSKDDKTTNGGTNDGNHDITVELLASILGSLQALNFSISVFFGLIIALLFNIFLKLF